MKADDIARNLPGEWFEDEGIKLTDTPQAFFLHDGRPHLGLFARQAADVFNTTAPMAVSQSENIYVVVEAEVNGYFRPKVRLALKAIDGSLQHLNIPLSSLASGFEDSAQRFFAWAHATSPILSVVPLPRYMFARNLKLRCDDFKG